MNRKTIGVIALFLMGLILIGLLYRNSRKEPEAVVMENLQVFLPGQEISALMDDGEKLWVGTPDGIYLLDRDTGETMKQLDSDIEMIYAAAFARTPDGTVWAGHDQGLCAFDREGTEQFRLTAPLIPGGRVNALYVSKEGLWAGMQEGAVLLAQDGENWAVQETLTGNNGLCEDVVQVIEPVGEELWFGSYLAEGEGGISIRKKDGWSYLSTKDGIQHRYINAILPLSEEEVLIGSGHMVYGGLCLAGKQDDGWTITDTWDQENGIPGMKVRYLFLDRQKRLWITTESDGVMILDGMENLFSMENGQLQGTCIRQENGLADNEVKCMAETDSCIWLGGKYGLTRYGK
ncbi:MAG: hypothetical protein K6A92_07580 [Lachnospiraceae bacterium]|nr:hypothetical protein [Lachnospiraceae bacterium]